MVGVVGPESAGKTTLVRLIAGTLRPTAGRIIVRGRVAPPPETLAKLLEPAHTPARNLRLVAAMIGSPQSLALSSAPDIFAAAGLTGLERRPLQSLSPDTASALVMAAFLHLEIDVFLFDPAPKIRSAAIRERLFALLERRLQQGASALATARTEARLPDGCQYIFTLEDGCMLQFGPVGVVRKAALVPAEPAKKFLGRSDAVAVGELSVTTDASGGATSICVPVEVLDPTAELTFGVMLAHEGRATAKYTEQYEAGTAGARLVTVHIPGQRQLAGKHRVHFSIAVVRGDDKQVVLAEPIKATCRRGLHGADAEARWSIEAR